MKISDIKVYVLEPWGPFQWTNGVPPTYLNAVLFTVIADNGMEGHCITWLNDSIGVINENLPYFRGVFIGQDPHFVEKFSQEVTRKNEYRCSSGSAIDIAIWDLLGKYHNEPVYKLLGAKRDKILAYASTVRYDTDQEYIDLAFKCRDMGFKALKLHPYAVPDEDIRLCKALRDAVGDSMQLMIDPVCEYDRKGALKVGKVLQELDFTWFECPIPDTDIDGLKWLRSKLDIPIAAAESHYTGLRGWTEYLRSGALDSIRAIGDCVGGITVMRKMAAIAEAFNVNFESHSYGPITILSAHLHVMLTQNNCAFIELPVPLDQFSKYTLELVKPDQDGYVHAPTKPGLGYDLDWDMIKAKTIRELDGKALPGEISPKITA